MTRWRFLVALAIILGLIGGAAVWGWWFLAVGRLPLRGEVRHDFGDIVIHGDSAGSTHTFRLTNVSREVIKIDSVKPSCGCTRARASTRSVEPGAEVEIDVTLTLSRPGHKKTHVTLALEGLGGKTLWVEGVGRKKSVLWANQHSVTLVPGELTPMNVAAAQQTSGAPPAVPTIRSPAGVTATFVKWEQMGQPDDEDDPDEPWHWRGRLELLLAEDQPLDPDAMLVLSLPGDEPVRVRVLSFGVNPASAAQP